MRATALAVSLLVSRKNPSFGERTAATGRCPVRAAHVPRTARMAGAPFSLEGLIDLPEAEEFLAPATGQGMPVGCGDAGKPFQAGREALHMSCPAKCRHGKAAFAFHSRQDIA